MVRYSFNLEENYEEVIIDSKIMDVLELSCLFLRTARIGVSLSQLILPLLVWLFLMLSMDCLECCAKTELILGLMFGWLF